MTDIYTTPDPETESWWSELSALQELRDQTIHTKQHLSQDRYSTLLSKTAINTIKVYQNVIYYYGGYILCKDRYLINEYPYNLGYDDIYPLLMNERTYRDIYNSMHNPTHPL